VYFVRKSEKNAVQPDRPQMTIRRMRIACRTPNTTDTDSEYIILSVLVYS